jgi:hypothetical protein
MEGFVGFIEAIRIEAKRKSLSDKLDNNSKFLKMLNSHERDSAVVISQEVYNTMEATIVNCPQEPREPEPPTFGARASAEARTEVRVLYELQLKSFLYKEKRYRSELKEYQEFLAFAAEIQHCVLNSPYFELVKNKVQPGEVIDTLYEEWVRLGPQLVAFFESKLKDFKLRDKDDIRSHVAKLDKLVNVVELAGGKVSESAKRSYFLNSIRWKHESFVQAAYGSNTTYDVLKTQFLSCNDSLSKRNREEDDIDGEKKFAFLSKRNKITKKRKKETKNSCSFCHRANHTADECFRNPKATNVPEAFLQKQKGILEKALATAGKKNYRQKYAFTATQKGSSSMDVDTSTVKEDIRTLKIRLEKVELNESDSEYFSRPNPTSLLTTRLEALHVQRSSKESDSGSFIVDCGATTHMIGDIRFLRPNSKSGVYDEVDVSITVANNHVLNSRLSGSVSFKVAAGQYMVIDNVLMVPGICANLLSVGQLTREGYVADFHGTSCSIYHPERPNLKITGSTGPDNLYKTHGTLVQADICVAYLAELTPVQSYELWHHRLGHISDRMLIQAIQAGQFENCDIHRDFSDTQRPLCHECCKGKMTAKHHKKPRDRALKPGELIHSDIWGPAPVQSKRKFQYFCTFIDDFSGMTVVDYLVKKSDVVDRFKAYDQMIYNRLGYHCGTLHSDNGEYRSYAFKDYCERYGVQQLFAAPYSHSSNGVAERKNRTLLDIARASLIGLPSNLWPAAVSHANYVRNRCPSRVNPNKASPFELWAGRKPSIGHLRIFGCKAQVYIPKEKGRNKLQPRSHLCTFIGYPHKSKGYLFLTPTGKEIISDNATFDELTFLKLAKIRNCQTETEINQTEKEEESVISAEEFNSLPIPTGTFDSTSHDRLPNQDAKNDDTAPLPSEQATSLIEPEIDANSEKPDNVIDSSTKSLPDHNPDQIVSEHEDAHTNIPHTEFEEILSEDEDDDHTKKKTAFVLAAMAFSAATSQDRDPKTYRDAMNSVNRHQWKKSMEDEIDSIVKNDTWELTHLPKGRKAIGLKWVYKTKRDENGNISRYKSRLVVKGFSQKYGVDYEETWAPVANYSSVRMLLTIAATKDLEIVQYDVKTAFLHGEIDVKTIYVQQPEGFNQKGHEGKVYRLKKSLYGLKQAPRIWNQCINKEFLKFGLKQSKRDPCIYTRIEKNEYTILLVFVDDVILASNTPEKYHTLFQKSSIDIKCLGDLKHFLGIRIERDRKRSLITIDQTVYLERLLTKYGMLNCKPVGTPIGKILTKDMSPKAAEEKQRMTKIPYRQVVGSLSYLAISTRPDISKAISMVSKYLENPGKEHWNAVLRILRYLSGTRDYKLYLGGTSSITLQAWSDADWAGEPDTRRSTTGYLVFLGNSPISWKSRLQPTVAASTTEAEYMAAFEACSELMYLKPLLHDMGYTSSQAIKVYEDNNGCIALSKDASSTGKSKHIDIKYHFIREQVEKGTIKLVECFTDDMIADILTKGLAKRKHDKFVELMQLKNTMMSQSSLSGSVGNQESRDMMISQKKRRLS